MDVTAKTRSLVENSQFGRVRWFTCRFFISSLPILFVSAIFVAAGVLKAHQLAVAPSLDSGLLSSRLGTAAVVQAEWFLATWLLSGLRQQGSMPVRAYINHMTSPIEIHANYRKVQGDWFPVNGTKIRRDSRGKLTQRLAFQVQSVSLNTPISANEFFVPIPADMQIHDTRYGTRFTTTVENGHRNLANLGIAVDHPPTVKERTFLWTVLGWSLSGFLMALATTRLLSNNTKRAILDRRGRPRCSAFTLVELLVVIAIVAMLVALLLPAIQAARQASRRIHCANNFKQAALAILNYASNGDKLPPLFDIRYGDFDASSLDRGTGWRYQILPYLEEQAIYDRLADPRGWRYDSSRKLPQPTPSKPAVLKAFLCPATPGTPRLETRTKVVSRATATVLYDAFAARQTGAVGVIIDSPSGRHEQGAWMARKFVHDEDKFRIYRRHPAPLKLITSGFSKTFLVVEKAGRTGAIFGPRIDDPGNVSSDSWINGHYNLSEELWFLSHAEWEDRGLPNHPSRSAINFTNSVELYSFHPGGAHVSMCDGSVRFLAEDTSLSVIFALATRDTVNPPDWMTQ